MTNDIIYRAVRMAHRWHRGQFRKYTGDPYIYHPMRVMNRVLLLDWSTSIDGAIGVLHDVIEDCGITKEALENQFGKEISVGVQLLTNPSKTHPELSRADKKQIDKEHIESCPTYIKEIKCLDRIDNLKETDIIKAGDFAKLYAEESLGLLEVMAKDVDKSLSEELNKEIQRLLV